MKFEFDDLRRIRNSLFYSGVVTLIIANLELLSDSIEVFGLELAVSQSGLVATGQLIVSLLLLAYFLRGIPAAIKFYLRIKILVDKDWENRTGKKISEAITPPSNDQETEYLYEPFEIKFAEERKNRRRSRERTLAVQKFFVSFSNGAIEIGFVLIVSFLVIFQPEALSNYLHSRSY